MSILGWSPDSNLIIYAHVEEYKINYPNEITIEVADVNRESQFFKSWSSEIIHPICRNVILGWNSSSTFFIYRDVWEAAPRYLREVNIGAKRIKTLFSGPFAGIDLDEITGTVFLNQIEFKGEMGTREEGIFRLNPQTGKPDLLLPGVWEVYWSNGLNSLVASTEENGQRKSILFTSDGRKIKEYESQLFPSPDGEWLLIADRLGTKLYNKRDELVANFADESYRKVVWLKDSSGFFGIKGNLMSFHAMENDWQGTVVVSDFYDGEIIYP